MANEFNAFDNNNGDKLNSPFAANNVASPFGEDYKGVTQPLDPNTAAAGFGRGTAELKKNFYKTVEAIAEVFDADDIAAWGAQGAAANADEALQYGTPIRFKDAESLSDYAEFFTTHGASAVPSLLGMLAGGLVGGLVGGPGGAFVGVGGMSGVQNIGTVASRTEELGEDEMGIGGWALAAGATALDMIAVGRITKPFVMAPIKQAVKDHGVDVVKQKLIKGMTKAGVTKAVAQEAAVAATAEAAASAANVAAIEYGSHAIAGVEADDAAIYDQMIEAAVLGGTIGAPFGAVGGYIKTKNAADFVLGSDRKKEPGRISKMAKRIQDSAVGRTWDKLAGNVMAPINRKIGKTSAGRFVVDLFTNKFEESRRDHGGKIETILQNVEDKARTKYGKGWRKNITKDLKNGVENPATLALREALDEVANISAKKKLISADNFIEDYLPSNMDKKRILDNWTEFTSDLETRVREKQGEEFDQDAFNSKLVRYREGLETGDWGKDYLDIIDERSLIDGEETPIKGKMSPKEQATVKHGNIEGSRIWDVDQDFYNEWSVDKNEGEAGWSAIERYMADVPRRWATADTFGKNGEILNRAIIDSNKELATVGERINAQDLAYLNKALDASQGRLGRIEDPFWRGVASVGAAFVNITTLPLVTFSSFVEVMNVAIKTDVSTAVKGTVNLLGHFGLETARRVAFMGPSNRHQTSATQMTMAGQSLRSATNAVLTRAAGADPTIGSRAAKITNTFFKINGLTYWTQVLRNYSSEVMRIKLKEDVDLVNNFPGTAEARQAWARLGELGLTAEEVQALTPGRESTMADSIIIDEIYAKAINRFNRRTALEPSFADRPLWMSDQKFWVLSRLQGYPTMFTNTVLPLLGKKLTGAPHQVVDGLFIIGFTTFIGSLQYGLRDAVTGRDPSDREMDDLLVDSIFRNLAHNPINMMKTVYDGIQYGRSPADIAAGPFIGKVGDVVSLLGTKEVASADTALKALEMLTPLGSFKSHWRN